MYEQENIPFAPTLVESLRSIGYSFEAAIADLLDNSISAEANNIEIDITSDENPYITIMDDGRGMIKEELEAAMKYGSKNPNMTREETDLGRFGLGMKSASLSQCRKMTVVSKKNGEVSGFSWDLDYIIKTNSWSMLGYSQEEIKSFPHSEKFLRRKFGTMIILENFDRIKESTNDLGSTLTKNIINAEEHIALVFHRFLEDGLNIEINGRKLQGKDPFLVTNKKTQPKREQKIRIGDVNIIAKPYILPHISNLTKEDIIKVGGKDRLKKEQGFYIYRNKRLIIWGTWFRLGNKDELSKLARVKVDIPNSLDYMWSIDIKKSSANLPDKIKKSLYSSVVSAVSESEKVHTHRGRRIEENEDFQYIWEKIQSKDRKSYDYKVNREIPQIKIIKESLTATQYGLVERLLVHLERNFPSTNIYLDVCKGELEQNNSDVEELLEELKATVKEVINTGIEIKEKDFVEELIKVEPYCRNYELVKIAKKKWGI